MDGDWTSVLSENVTITIFPESLSLGTKKTYFGMFQKEIKAQYNWGQVYLMIRRKYYNIRPNGLKDFWIKVVLNLFYFRWDSSSTR